jgi:hypothetical protein
MDKREAFSSQINEGYSCTGDNIVLGCPILDGEIIAGSQVKVPLKTMNRHGLIAGALLAL